jgi:AcrR family transcriptional regulator
MAADESISEEDKGRAGSSVTASDEAGPTAADAAPVKAKRGRKADPNSRDKLLHAAGVAFMERGFSGTSIDDIANVLGVTKGYVYHHYTSKSELYFGVQEAAMLRIDASVRPVFDSEVQTLPKMERMAFEHALFIMNNFPAAKVGLQGLERSLMKAAGIQARRDLRRAIRMRDDYEGMFRTVIANGIAEGVFVDESVGLLTKGALGSLNWLTLWFDSSRSTTQAQMKDMAQRLAAYAVRGLRR